MFKNNFKFINNVFLLITKKNSYVYVVVVVVVVIVVVVVGWSRVRWNFC